MKHLVRWIRFALVGALHRLPHRPLIRPRDKLHHSRRPFPVLGDGEIESSGGRLGLAFLRGREEERHVGRVFEVS